MSNKTTKADEIRAAIAQGREVLGEGECRSVFRVRFHGPTAKRGARVSIELKGLKATVPYRHEWPWPWQACAVADLVGEDRKQWIEGYEIGDLEVCVFRY